MKKTFILLFLIFVPTTSFAASYQCTLQLRDDENKVIGNKQITLKNYAVQYTHSWQTLVNKDIDLKYLYRMNFMENHIEFTLFSVSYDYEGRNGPWYRPGPVIEGTGESHLEFKETGHVLTINCTYNTD